MARHQRISIARSCALGLALLAACRSTESYRLEADAEVYRLLAEKRAAFVSDPSAFRIEPSADSLRERLLGGEIIDHALSLVETLDIGAENSRDYQARREELYRAALDLTFERFRFSVQENGALAGLLDGSGDDLSAAELDGDLGMSKLLGTGASIVGNIGLSLFRLAGVGDSASLSSNLSLSVTQPLLRGFGPDIVRESLTRTERELIYAVRDYERFRRSFAVDVANRYFRILQNENTLENAIANSEQLALLRERNERYAEAGQLSEIQADQARQDEFRAQSSVISARQQLERSYDDFKFFLGLPIAVELTLDQAEFDRLREEGLRAIPEDVELVVRYGLERRLDLQTVRDRVHDSERSLAIAADSLRPGLGLAAGASSSSESSQPFDHDLDGVVWNLDLVLELPFERLPERNAFRSAIISLDAAQRSAVALEDAIVADLRDALRNLESRAEDYRIQVNALQLNQSRVASSDLNLQAGRAQTRDVLEAQEDLVSAQNALTAALVDYYLAALGLYRDMEALRVDASGLSFESIERRGGSQSAP